jgi:hypothetical protein
MTAQLYDHPVPLVGKRKLLLLIEHASFKLSANQNIGVFDEKRSLA